jgi:hypothetical protein
MSASLVGSEMFIRVRAIEIVSQLLIQAIPNPNTLAFSSTGLLVYWTDCVVPGILAAQLFRLPKTDRYPSNLVAIEAAPSNTR